MQRMMKISWKHTVIASLTAALLGGCAGGVPEQSSPTQAEAAKPAAETAVQTQAPKSEGHLKIAVSNDVDGLDPHRTVSASTFQVTNNIFDTLIGTDPSGNLQPRLAEKWTPSADGKAWTFALKKGVKFHNGRDMTAEDVQFSLERLMGEGSPRAKDYSSVIDKVTADSPEQLTITLKQGSASFLSSLAMPWAAVVPKESVEQLKQKPVGTGAFRLVEWVPQQKVVLEKNADYYGKTVSLDKVEFLVIPDSATQLINLKSGQVHIAGLSGEQAEEVKKDQKLQLYTKPSNSVQLMALNNKVAPLDNMKVRQAIALAVNKEQVIIGSNWGFGAKIGSHLSPSDTYYKDFTKTLEHDVTKAKELLKEAGLEKGFDLTLSLPQPYAVHVKAGEVVADQLKQIGVNVKLETVDWGKWVKDIYTGRQYEATIIAHTGRLDPDAMLSRYATDSKENYMNYSNAAVDEALKKGTVTIDAKERKDIYASVQETLASEVPAVYLQAPYTLLGMSAKVKGFETYPIDIYELSNVSLQ
ncbi:ABC transporter substrate-binding protein [Paenibacillus turpanensis]|uniref:ABC transporter substrate-binding protein n=1 Tax=Paenibacillus turpanensis TaxID=2689078 RepID=UPI00140A91EE|nr:ABC transporter substrate-binding protein [Paenibacillus turpanensis]